MRNLEGIRAGGYAIGHAHLRIVIHRWVLRHHSVPFADLVMAAFAGLGELAANHLLVERRFTHVWVGRCLAI